MEIYKQPLYYEIAFSFIDSREQVDNFEKIIREFSKIKVDRFFDVACGPSLQLREIARRDYEAIGLDLSLEMLTYLREKAKGEGVEVETVQEDMTDFSLKKKADFAFIMMGSLTVESNDKFLSHLDSVAASLNKGGLYFIQNMGLGWTGGNEQSWTMEIEGITVGTTFEFRMKDAFNQIGTEKLTFEVNDNGTRKKFADQQDLKVIFPQEFKTLVKLNGRFEFLGWWKGNCNKWYLDQPLEKVKDYRDNMVLLRKT